MLNQLLKDYQKPGCEFRGAPFWAWNAKLEPEELRRQIRLMKDMGMGGFFMHARVGLNTEYLGREWFECVKACIDEAEKLDMNAWLYDEDRWPSGTAGGLVTRDDAFKSRRLRCERLTDPAKAAKDGLDIAWFTVRLDGYTMLSWTRIASPAGVELSEGEEFLRFSQVYAPKSGWFNGETYLDTMNPKAVEKFVETTHEAYRKEIADKFGKSVPGIFTDEPCYVKTSSDASQWTDSLPEEFRKRFGYDLRDYLPELFFPKAEEAVSEARWHYFNLSTNLFTESFGKVIGDWCARNNMKFTGHILGEDSLSSQTFCVGAAMRFYEHQQLPGIDVLTEHWNIFNTAKQCVSAAHQFGRGTRLSESYGCTGWDFPFFGHKALGDWQFALGITFRCMHLAWYSMSGEAKRDYPASISYQSPWYRQYPYVEDYFGRLNAVMSKGEEVRHVLVVHPIESLWCVHPRIERVPEEEKIEDRFQHLTNYMLAEHLDFDFGDEELMSRYTKTEGTNFRVGKAVYKFVVIPELVTIRSSTLKLLTEFAEAGGKVAYLGKAPAYVDARPSDAARTAYKRFHGKTESELRCFATEAGACNVSITDLSGKQIPTVLYRLTESEDAATLFLCTLSMPLDTENKSAPMVRDRHMSYPYVSVGLQMEPGRHVYELDAATGEIRHVRSLFAGGKYLIETSLPELGSRLYLFSKEEIADALPAANSAFARKPLAGLPTSGWKAEPDDPNVRLFDRGDFSADGVKLGTDVYYLDMDNKLRDLLGKPRRGGAMVQPWVTGQRKADRTLDTEIVYSFDCAALPRGTCHFAIEHAELYEFEFNGTKIPGDVCGWWIDIVIEKIVLPAELFRTGRNVIKVRTQYHEDLPGIEATFLLGDFGVKDDTLVERAEILDCSDWCAQTFPYYAGNMKYSIDLPSVPRPVGKRVFLRIPEWRGTALGVSVNGGKEILCPFPPFEADVTDTLCGCGNLISVTVYGHRRNAFGPFYLNTKWPDWTNANSFRNAETAFRQLVPCGLLAAPVLETER